MPCFLSCLKIFVNLVLVGLKVQGCWRKNGIEKRMRRGGLGPMGTEAGFRAQQTYV